MESSDDESLEDEELLILNILHDDATSFRNLLSIQQKRNRSGVIRRGALMRPASSAFMFLFNSGQDDALITLCGFDHRSFRLLLALFDPLYESYVVCEETGLLRKARLTKRGKKVGQKRAFTSTMLLGLILAWTRTRGSLKVLQIIFGFTAAPLSRWIRYGRRLLVLALRDQPEAKIQLPSDEEIATFQAVIGRKYRHIPLVWGALDGLKLLLERAGEEDTQNAFYNGWTHDHYISCLFLFSPDGRIRAAYLNSPGSWHDSTNALYSGIYEKLDALYNRLGAQVVVDSAFNAGAKASMIKSHQSNIDQQGRVGQRSQVFRDATSVRQLSEWGMRGFPGSSPRIKDRLFYEEAGERRVILSLITLLYNYRATAIGYNQIQSVFMPFLHQDTNLYIFS